MNTDAYFVTGYAHLRKGEPCQDYAEASPLAGGGAYAVVSDGCSSGGRTDLGSRLLSLATAQAIRAHWAIGHSPDPNTAVPEIAAGQRAITTSTSANLGLDVNDLLATCAYAYLGSQRGYAFVYGDGLIAQLLADGSILVDKLEWKLNMPCYPAYADDNFVSFISAHGGDLEEASALTVERWLITPEIKYGPVEKRAVSLGNGIRGQLIELEPEGVKAVAVLTDGVCQVDGVSWQETVARLFAFKSVTGKFAVRRMNRFLKEVNEHGQGPFDDLSYAVILTD